VTAQAPAPPGPGDGDGVSDASEDSLGPELIREALDTQERAPYGASSIIPPASGSPFAGLSIHQTHIVQENAVTPALLEALERHAPGAVGRLLVLAEKQQDAGLRAQANAQAFTRSDIMRAHYIAAFLSVFAMLCALGALAMHYPWVAGSFLAFPVPAIINALNGLRTKS
jgi:uncharacterized membrane protein